MNAEMKEAVNTMLRNVCVSFLEMTEDDIEKEAMEFASSISVKEYSPNMIVIEAKFGTWGFICTKHSPFINEGDIFRPRERKYFGDVHDSPDLGRVIGNVFQSPAVDWLGPK